MMATTLIPAAENPAPSRWAPRCSRWRKRPAPNPGRQIEVAQNAFGQPADILQEHRLPLAVRADDQVMKAQRQLDDRIEAGERAVARPHFLDQNPAVARAEQMDHAPGQNRFREPIGRLLNGRLLLLYDGEQFTAFLQVPRSRTHGRRRYRFLRRGGRQLSGPPKFEAQSSTFKVPADDAPFAVFRVK